MNIPKLLFSKVRSSHDFLFEDIFGYDQIKRLFGMTLNSKEPVHILLSGPPASAKTMFLQSMMTRLSNSYFVDGGNTTKSGMIDYLFENTPKYLLIDEIDKMPTKDQTFLLNLMETGILTETKYRKTRTAKTNVKTWVFATSNNTEKIMSPLQSRFFIVKLEAYAYEQFYHITVQLLTQQHKVKPEVAKGAANAVWNKMKSANVRDCVKIGRMAKSIEDVNFIVDTFQ
jgi:Holliday junction resolvasome RuvABC ATP-dependent DNA helicase subunit